MIVFLHGVPETSALWDKLRADLGRESVALSLPGFGCPRPEGFGATKEDYVAWVTGELEKFDEPVDLVGHDWGALLTYRIATTRGELLRSWTADVASGTHPSAKWHDFARIWQTPGDGEAYFENIKQLPIETMAEAFLSYNISHEDAAWLASSAHDEFMGGCILDLYRSATPNLYADWGTEFTTTSAPGLALIATEDPFCNDPLSREMAEVFGARVAVFEGLGHWWALQDPKGTGQRIVEFIESV